MGRGMEGDARHNLEISGTWRKKRRGKIAGELKDEKSLRPKDKRERKKN